MQLSMKCLPCAFVLSSLFSDHDAIFEYGINHFEKDLIKEIVYFGHAP